MAAITLIVAIVAGLVLLLVEAGDREGGVQFSNAVVVTGFSDVVPPNGQLCSGPIARIDSFERVRFSLGTRATDPSRVAAPRLLVRVLAADGSVVAGPAVARLTAADVARDYADARVPKVPAGSPIRVCVTNASSARVLLWSGIANALRAGRTTIGTTVAPATPELLFYQDPTPSVLARVPAMFRRAAIWHPDWLGTWSIWALAAVLALGVPALLAFALLRSPDEDDGADAAAGDGRDDDPQERWRRFQAEVEPALAATPRVHRFAAVPLVGDAQLSPTSLTVGIVGGGAAVATTRAALEQSTRAPAVLDGAELDALLREATTEHVLLLAAGDTLAPVAVERFGQALTLAPDARVVTSDHDTVDRAGRPGDPRVFPGPSPDLLLARDLAGAAVCVRRDDALAALAVAPLEPDAWQYDLVVRLAGADGAGHAHVPLLLVHRGERAAPRAVAQRRVVERELAVRGGTDGVRVEEPAPGRRRIRRTLERHPSVEAIVLFRDKPELLRRCVTSLLDRSTYGRLTVRLVDNGSVEPATAALVEELTRDSRVVAMADPRPFNFAALNNAAVAASEAEVVVFLNNDTEVRTPDWVEQLLEEALRPEVGAVAPLLLFADGTVQHAGAALGLHGYAGHPFAGLAPEQQTPFGSATDGVRNWLAVTAACLMIERTKLDAVGGFDETFVVAGNDVDLCLRLTAAGLRSLCVPHVRLLHDESQSRGTHVDPGDFARSEERYGAFRTVGDPFYNPQLTLRDASCRLRAPGE